MHEGIDSVLVDLTSPEILENSNKVYKLWTRNLGLEVFVSNDRTIEQLKNSGDLRLIRINTVSDGIMQYDQAIKKYSTQSNMMYNAMTNMTYYSELFDFLRLQKNPDIPVPLRSALPLRGRVMVTVAAGARRAAPAAQFR